MNMIGQHAFDQVTSEAFVCSFSHLIQRSPGKFENSKTIGPNSQA